LSTSSLLWVRKELLKYSGIHVPGCMMVIFKLETFVVCIREKRSIRATSLHRRFPIICSVSISKPPNKVVAQRAVLIIQRYGELWKKYLSSRQCGPSLNPQERKADSLITLSQRSLLRKINIIFHLGAYVLHQLFLLILFQ
jgi:hypothetical protein